MSRQWWTVKDPNRLQILRVSWAVIGVARLVKRCWCGITFFGPPWCAACGLPFPHPIGEDALCGACARERHSWDRARAVLRYDKNSRRLVLGLKHGDRTHLVPAFGRWMRRAGSEILSGADLLVPVPLHWTRLFQRRYNQAAQPRNLRSSVSGNVQQVSDIA